MLRAEIKMDIHDGRNPKDVLLKKYQIPASWISSVSIHHRSLDARFGHPAVYVYQMDLESNHEKELLKRIHGSRQEEKYVYKIPEHGDIKLKNKPVVIGMGPAGMAAGLLLAYAGYMPLILERGPAIPERQKAVSDYWKTGILNPEANVQFGEGGAGAFSDGKLTTRVKDKRVSVILEALIEAGADPSIAWMNHPHVGTDKFCGIDANIRKKIESLGGEVRFSTCMNRLLIHNNQVAGIITNHNEEISAEAVILAIGHSARDTFQMLYEEGIPMEAKQFAAGVRVEHLQSFIDHQQYRKIKDPSVLPPSEYHLAHTSSLHKGTYTFCMCPGGYVVASASEPGTIVTNGMSYSRRDGINANSAVLVQIDQSDYGEGVLAGVRYQQALEHSAYLNGKAPCMTIKEYLTGKEESFSEVKPTYSLGVEHYDLHKLFSSPINQSLEEFFLYTEKVFPGFTGNGSLMTGVESRSSSPVRILRNPSTLSSMIEGLYPSGEGAGFAGGIVSSAIDGMKCAEKIIEKYF